MGDIGIKIRTRKQKCLALKELSARVGTTSSFLSQVENNKTTLSISVLKRIAEALDVKIVLLAGRRSCCPTRDQVSGGQEE